MYVEHYREGSLKLWELGISVEPYYNRDLGTTKFTLLYQVSHIRVKRESERDIKAGTNEITLL